VRNILWFYEALFAVMALFALAIGLRGLIRRRPLVFSARWLFGFLSLAFVPQVVNPLWLGFGHSSRLGGSGVMAVLSPAFFLFMTAVFWVQMRGYLVFGVTDTTFRGALQHTLNERGLRYEERLGSVHLPTEGLDLQVVIHGWMGTAQMKMKGSRDSGRLAELSSGMQHYYATNTVEVPKLVFIIYLVMGVFLAGTGVKLATI
jgi:hypothetical protein